MKKIILLLVLSSLLNFAGSAQTIKHQAKKEMIRPVKCEKKPTVVKARKGRMRLQLQQIKQHKKQLKGIDSTQKELNKELHKTD